MTGKLGTRPVGVISMGKQDENVGKILGITLRQDMLGRYYSEQFLGCAFSHFRRLGCTQLQAAPGNYPEDLLDRYGFSADTFRRNIDPKVFAF